MTGDLLQTDIDLAQGLLNAGRADREVVAALVQRRVPAHRAAEVVAELRAGRKVEPDPPSGARSLTGQGLGDACAAGPPDQPRKRDRRDQKPEPSSVPWFTLAVLSAFAICAAAFIISRRRAEANAEAASPAVTNAEAATVRALRPGALALEVLPDGLHVCGQLVNRANALSTLAKVLGFPSRTNQVQGLDWIMYVYDAEGLLIYSQPRAGDDSLVLSFEAIGGTNAAKMPFSGTFKIESTPILGSTDAKKLGAIKELGLASPGTDSGVFEGRYNGLEINFAYLESSERLSLVTINLK